MSKLSEYVMAMEREQAEQFSSYVDGAEFAALAWDAEDAAGAEIGEMIEHSGDPALIAGFDEMIAFVSRLAAQAVA
jgi:hypothetical protein